MMTTTSTQTVACQARGLQARILSVYARAKAEERRAILDALETVAAGSENVALAMAAEGALSGVGGGVGGGDRWGCLPRRGSLARPNG